MKKFVSTLSIFFVLLVTFFVVGQEPKVEASTKAMPYNVTYQEYAHNKYVIAVQCSHCDGGLILPQVMSIL